MLSRLAQAIGLGGQAKEVRWLGRLADVTVGTVASKPALSLPPDAPLAKALKMMHSHGIGALNVSEGDGPLQGIVTERDILLKHDFDDVLCTAPVGGLMTSAVEVASPSWSLARCLELMLERHCRHLPVLDDAASATGSTHGRVDAVLSMRDLCHFLTSDEAPPDAASAALTLGDAIKDARHLWQPEVPAERSVAEAAEAMRKAGTGSVLIPLVDPALASSAQAFGLFTERDLLKVLAAQQYDPRSLPVIEHMTAAADLIWAEPDYPIIDALRLLDAEGIRHLPVVGAAPNASACAAPPTVIAMVSMRELLARMACDHPRL